MRIAIVGAGASGMMAAIAAAQTNPQAQIVLLERQARAGKKLLATGNGRCNLTNQYVSLQSYHGDVSFAERVFKQFDQQQTLALFEKMGLQTVCETNGRIYPFSDRANSVLDVLRLQLDLYGITLLCDTRLMQAKRKKSEFILSLQTEQEQSRTMLADRLIICAGGLACAKLGGSNDGYRILEQFGHKKIGLHPSLVKLRTDPAYPRALKGIRTDARIQILHAENKLAESCGEIQFTDNGISGPAAFEVSRAASVDASADCVELDLCRILPDDALFSYLQARKSSAPELACHQIFTGFLHHRLGQMLVRSVGIAGELPCGALGKRQLKQLTDTTHHFRLALHGTADFAEAQVTAGGISCAAFTDTLQSTLCPGLYAAGEVLNVDGDCGGYNLQWAWSSGYVAGVNAAGQEDGVV